MMLWIEVSQTWWWRLCGINRCSFYRNHIL